MHSGRLPNNPISLKFVAPTFASHGGQSLILRLKHSGQEDHPLALGSTTVLLKSSSKSSLTNITLFPILGHSESDSETDHLSFKPGIRYDIVIQFGGLTYWGRGHL